MALPLCQLLLYSIYLFFLKAPLLINSLLCLKSFFFLCGEVKKKNHLPFNGVSDLFSKPCKRVIIVMYGQALSSESMKTLFAG